MITNCLSCKKLFDQKPVNYKMPDTQDNHHNFGDCHDCFERKHGYFLEKFTRQVPVIQKMNKYMVEHLDEKTKRAVQEFFVENYFYKENKFRTRQDMYPTIKQHFGIEVPDAYLIRSLKTKTLQESGFKVTFKKSKKKIER